MFCPWCGKERDENALAIHHCGPTDRPPVHCMQCGRELEPGAAACASCGLAAGQKPTPVTAGARVGAVAAASAEAAAPPEAPAQQPAAAPLRPQPQAAAAATRHQPVATAQHVAKGRLLRQGALGAAVAGVCSFFIPWGVGLFGIAGITVVERAKWSWWTPPCAQLLFIGFLTAAALGAIAYRSRANTVDVIMAVLGVGLMVALGRWLWLTRHTLDVLTGFWLTVGAAVLLAAFAIASALHDRSVG